MRAEQTTQGSLRGLAGSSAVLTGEPGDLADLDPLVAQLLGLLRAGVAIDAALVDLAVVHLAGFLREARPDMVEVLLNVLLDLPPAAHRGGGLLGIELRAAAGDRG